MKDAKNDQSVVDAIVDYLRSTQWKDIIQVVQERDMNHMHAYVDSYVEPRDLARVFVGYMKMRGWDFYRDVDFLRTPDGRVALYAFLPYDKIKFVIYCRMLPDVVLEPTPPPLGECGSNVRTWTDGHIRRHVNQYDWRQPSEAETAVVHDFFSDGEHWANARELILDPDVVHIHCNIETNVHPSIIRDVALDDLKRRGWEIKHAWHCVYQSAKNIDQGKIIFIGLRPAKTYDVAWFYNPSVTIQANTQETLLTGDEGSGNLFYVLRKSALDADLKKWDLIPLSDAQVEEILDRSAHFDRPSYYSWRVVPSEFAS